MLSFGKLLAVLAVMSVALNAQCAVSCSVRPTAIQAHNCCKHHKASQPCAQQVVSEVQTPQYIAATPIARFEVALRHTGFISQHRSQPDPLTDRKLFSILRI